MADADEWVIRFARIALQDADYRIEHLDEDRVTSGTALLAALQSAGVSNTAIESHWVTICSGNAEFASAIHACWGSPKAAYDI
ncbi:hypothetical protein [Cupriavidus pauculus]|uniref:hypothetical protein n=1 Tax=Cupriavidus pauculus TaxID=82633 RepID=UPI001EE38D1C|nr:hypothetical protein [Cupriavidus pauculus]GJG96778.1 hypothetical protein CBA19C6_19835 [Cupriavidus pauculus]